MSSMVAWTRGDRSVLWAVVAMAVLAMGFVACASSVTTEGGVVPETETLSSTEPSGLSDVWVERQGDASVVTLVGLEDPVYTAFLNQDPAALVLDIASVSLSSTGDPMAVYDGLIEQVSVSSFGAGADEHMTRFDFALTEST